MFYISRNPPAGPHERQRTTQKLDTRTDGCNLGYIALIIKQSLIQETPAIPPSRLQFEACSKSQCSSREQPRATGQCTTRVLLLRWVFQYHDERDMLISREDGDLINIWMVWNRLFVNGVGSCSIRKVSREIYG